MKMSDESKVECFFVVAILFGPIIIFVSFVSGPNKSGGFLINGGGILLFSGGIFITALFIFRCRPIIAAAF